MVGMVTREATVPECLNTLIRSANADVTAPDRPLGETVSVMLASLTWRQSSFRGSSSQLRQQQTFQ